MRTVFNIPVIEAFRVRKEISDRCLVQQRVAQYTEYIEGGSVELAVMLDNSHETVCCDCRIYLDSNSILSVTPKELNPEMQFYPAKEQLHLPSFLVKQGNVFGLKLDIVGQERECSLDLRSIVNDPPQHSGILLPGLIAGKAYSLIKKYVIRTIQNIFTVNHLVIEAGFLPYDEIRSDSRYRVQSGKVIISFVKDVECIWLIRYLIHRLHIVHFSLRDMYINRYLSDHVKQRMHLDASFGLSEAGPFVETQAEIDCSGVESVKFTVNNELPINPLALRKVYHEIGKLFKDPVISMGIGIFQSTSGYHSLAKSEMITLILVGSYHTSKFPKTVATGQLAKTKQKKLVPTRHRLRPLVSVVAFNNLIEFLLWQKFHELTEDIFSGIHACLVYLQAAIIRNEFKSFLPNLVIN